MGVNATTGAIFSKFIVYIIQILNVNIVKVLYINKPNIFINIYILRKFLYIFDIIWIMFKIKIEQKYVFVKQYMDIKEKEIGSKFFSSNFFMGLKKAIKIIQNK